MNQTLKIIQDRRSVRKFSEQQIKYDELQDILEAAKYAPSGDGKQPWHFIVLQKKELINDLSDVSKEVVKNHELENIKRLANNKNFNTFYSAPTVIIVCGDEKNLWAFADCAAATQNILLAAESIGLGACWINFGLFVFDTEKGDHFRKLLKVPPGYKPLYSVSLGYGKDDKPTAALRKANVVTYIE